MRRTNYCTGTECLVLQQQLDALTGEEFQDKMLEESLDGVFIVGYKVKIVGGQREIDELCEVSVWVKTYNGTTFLKRKHHVVVYSHYYTHLIERNLLLCRTQGGLEDSKILDYNLVSFFQKDTLI